MAGSTAGPPRESKDRAASANHYFNLGGPDLKVAQTFRKKVWKNNIFASEKLVWNSFSERGLRNLKAGTSQIEFELLSQRDFLIQAPQEKNGFSFLRKVALSIHKKRRMHNSP